jgi:peptidyl-prolyl cis-trans isomerase B (cyclophilin B)
MKILALPFPGLRFFALALTICGLSLSPQPGSLFAQDKPDTAETKEKAADDASKPADASEVKDIRIVIKTDKGDIKATMYAIKAPLTSANFLNLAERDYYDGIIFHRVVPNFVIQGGDPTGTGRGGPGYTIENEIDPDLLHDDAGIFSMARKPQPDTAGSQFFITHNATPHLDGGYSVFGKVTEGQDVVDSIRVGDKIKDIEILDSTDALFAKMKDRIDEWNKILDGQ